MELFYTLTSPYSRKILLLADHLGLTEQIKMTAQNPLEENTGRLKSVNPLEKIPTLTLEDDQAIYDSPVIAEVFTHMVDVPPLDFDTHLKHQKMQALADGIMDTAVALQQENMRPDPQQSDFWKTRWHNAILRSVVAFEQDMIDEAEGWHIGSMAMACALDYLRFRHPDLNWKKDCPKSDEWHQRMTAKNIMKQTDPRQL